MNKDIPERSGPLYDRPQLKKDIHFDDKFYMDEKMRGKRLPPILLF